MTDYYELGSHTWPVTTASPEAQQWFDRGLIWTYAFNHDEAISCFEQALQHDSDCAMAYWGIAYAAGPNYNKPWEAFDDLEYDKIDCDRALQASDHAISLPVFAQSTDDDLAYIAHAVKQTISELK